VFNVIVVSDKGDWDGENLKYKLHPLEKGEEYRFGLWSGEEFEATGISRAKPEDLTPLERIDTLLIYDTVRTEPEAEVVRVGHLEGIRKVRAGDRSELRFRFVQRGTVTRRHLLDRRELIAGNLNEFCREHWAVKDGNLPADLQNKVAE
jgi:hypothetical protein